MSEHELWNELGNLYFVSGYYDQAMYAYHRSIQLLPEFGRPYGNLALVMAQKGRYDESATLYEKCLALLEDRSEKVICLNKLGAVYRYLGNYEGAFRAYQEADRLEVGNELLLQKNSLLPYVDGKTPRALEELLAILKEPPAALVNSGTTAEENATDAVILYAAEGEEQSAHQPDEHVRGVETDAEIPSRIPDRRSINWFLYPQKSGLPDIREDFVYEPPILEPIQNFAMPLIHSNISMQLFTNRSWLEAPGMAVSNRLLEVDVLEKPEPFVMVVAEELNQPADDGASHPDPLPAPPVETISNVIPPATEKELNHFKRLVELDPGNAYGWAALGDLHKSVQAYQESILAYRQAVTLDPGNSSHHYHLGLVYAIEGEYEKAVSAFQKVVELDPQNSLAHASLGGYFQRMGLEELARRHINKARQDIYARENQYNQACFESICGNLERSLELLEFALNENQSKVDWALKDPDLENLRTLPAFHDLLARISAS